MFYKLTDTNSDTFKAVAKIREIERYIEATNIRRIKENNDIPDFSQFVGVEPQKSLLRTTQYHGFVFNPKDVNKSVWVKVRKNGNIYRPNARTKRGKDMRKFLASLLHSDATVMLAAFGITAPKVKFKPPYVECYPDVLVAAFDAAMTPAIPMEEISKDEFNQIINSHAHG